MLEPVRETFSRDHSNWNSSWPHPGDVANKLLTGFPGIRRRGKLSVLTKQRRGTREREDERTLGSLEDSVETNRTISALQDFGNRFEAWRIDREAAIMPTIKLLIPLLTIAAVRALPLSKVHVKFVSHPHVYEHGITTDGDRTISQRSFVSIGRRSTIKDPKEFGNRLDSHGVRGSGYIKPENAESLWPIGVFIPPVHINDLGYSWQEARHHMTPDFSDGLAYHDPYLLTGDDALLAVKYIYGRGELFYDDFPHERALLKNQEERRLNGLQTHVLNSLRPSSMFYRKAKN